MLADVVSSLNHPLGQACALLTAVLWGYAVVLFKLSGERFGPVALSLFKNTVGLVLLVGTLAALMLWNPRGLALLGQQHPGDLCLLLLSGIIGIAIADTIFFHALNLVGVGLIAVLDCAYSPLVILFSWLLLCETLTVPHYVGAALVVSGVFTATRHKLPAGRTRGQITLGVVLALAAIAMMAFGIVIAKPIIEDLPLLWTTTVRMTAGAFFLALFALLGRGWRRHWTVFRPSPTWKTALPAAIIGTYLCMVLWMGGFKYTHAAIAAVLNQTSVVFQSVFAALIIKEAFGVRKIAALVLSIVGVIVVTLAQPLEAWGRALWALAAGVF